MTTPMPPASLLLSAPIAVDVKKKRVLLVDTSQAKREVRAEVMRKFGMDVDCASDISEARSWWKVALYDLVLINMEKGLGNRDKFCDDIRGAKPPQRLAFLVGQPKYLANSPSGDEDAPLLKGDADDQIMDQLRVAVTGEGGDVPPRWGILEASRRISAVRSASLARTQAMRAVPTPPRDSERRPSKRILATISLDDLLREELQ